MNRREFFILALITFSTVIVWIALSLQRAQTTSTISPEQEREIIPLTPTFDNDIINALEKREE